MLRAEFAALHDDQNKARRLELLAKWRVDQCLSGLRDQAFLATLPENERSALRALCRGPPRRQRRNVEHLRLGAAAPVVQP